MERYRIEFADPAKDGESPCPEEVWPTREAAEKEGLPYWRAQFPKDELKVVADRD